MQESFFRAALEKSGELTEKAIKSRISRGNVVEEIMGNSLDYIVADDDRMFQTLKMLKSHPKEGNGRLSNSLRWYYKAVHNKEFPTLSYYERYNKW